MLFRSVRSVVLIPVLIMVAAWPVQAMQGPTPVDPFNYFYISSDEPGGPPSQFVDISLTGGAVVPDPGTCGSSDDDGRALTLAAPYRFDLYGRTRGAVSVSENGYISFNAAEAGGCTAFANDCGTSTTWANERIYAYWDDLVPLPATGNIYYQTFTANGLYTSCPVANIAGGQEACSIILWKDFTRFGDPVPVPFSFEVILFHASGEIRVVYDDLNDTTGRGATVGLADRNPTNPPAGGYDCGPHTMIPVCDQNGSLTSGMAISFLPPIPLPPDTPFPQPVADLALTKAHAPEPVDNGAPVTFTLTVTNNGPQDQTQVQVTDSFPSSLAYVENDCGATVVWNGITGEWDLTWDIGALANGGVVSCNVVLTVNACVGINNTALVTGDPALCDDPSNNTALDAVNSVALNPDPGFDLGNPNPVWVGAPTDNPELDSVGKFTICDPTGAGPAPPCPFTAWPPLSPPYVAQFSSAAGLFTAGILSETFVFPAAGSITLEFWLFSPALSGRLADSWTLDVDGTPIYSENSAAGPLTLASQAGWTLVGPFDVSAYADGMAHTVTISTTFNSIATPNQTIFMVDNLLLRTLCADYWGDLGIAKTVDNPAPAWGDTITYTVTVTDYGPDDQAGVYVTDAIPPEHVYLSDDCGGSYDPLTGIWTWWIGNLANGNSAACNISVQVTGCDPGGVPVDNTALVFGAVRQEVLPGNPEVYLDSATVAVDGPDCLADLGIAKTSDAVDSGNGPEIDYGQPVIFTLTASNAGPMPQTDVVVVDTFPAGLEYVDNDCGAVWDPLAGTLTWTIPVMNPLDVLACQVQAIGRDVNGACGLRTNSVTITGGDPTYPEPAPDPTPNGATYDLLVSRCWGDLEIQKTADNLVPYAWGQTVVYTLTVTNNGPMDATGVTVTDVLPPGVIFVDSACCDGGCHGYYTDGVFTWEIGDLANGRTVTCRIFARVEACDLIDNTAEVIGAADEFDLALGYDDTANNLSTVTIEGPVCQGDLYLYKSADNPTPGYFQVVTYTFRVGNAGPMPQTGVVMVDDWPAGMRFVDATCDTFISPDPVRSLHWNIGDLAIGQEVTCSVRYRLVGCADQTNTATVSGDPALLDPDDPLNPDDDNTAGVTVTGPPCEADLHLVGAADKAIALVGDTVTHSFWVYNYGPMPQSDVWVVETVPAGLVMVDNNCGAFFDAPTGTLLWKLGDLAVTTPGIPSGFCQVTYRVAACDPTGQMTATAVVSANPFAFPAGPVYPEPAPDPNPNVVPLTLAVPLCEADLSVTKTDDDADDVVVYGQTVVYTLTAANAGPMPQTGVVVTDSVPVGLSFVEATCDTWIAAGVLSWNVGSLGIGESRTCDVTFRVTGCGDFTNTATVAGGDPTLTDPDPTDDTAAVTLTGPLCEADLSVTKTDNDADDVVTYFQVVEFTLTVANAGPMPQTGVEVVDDFPVGMRFIDATCDVFLSRGRYHWNVGDLGIGESRTCTLRYRVVGCGDFTNTATVAGGDPVLMDPDAADDTAAVTLTGPACEADLSVTKTDDDADDVVVYGQTVVYTLTAANAGPMPQTGVVVTDSVPAGLSFVEATCDTWLAGGNLFWAVGNLGIGESRTCDVTFRVTGCGDFSNTATVAGGDPTLTDPDPTDDTAAVTLTGPLCEADLSVTKTDNDADDVVTYFQVVEFTLTVANAGPMPQTGVQVVDDFPAGMRFIDATCDVFLSRGRYHWNVGDLRIGESRTCALRYRVVDCGDFTNTATVTGGDPVLADPDPADDTASVTLTGPPCEADLSVTKTDDDADDVVDYGQTVVYTLTAANAGPMPQTGVVVTDSVPAGLVFVEATCDTWLSAGNLVWAVGNLGIGESRTCDVTFRAVGCGDLVNTAAVVGDTALTDPDPANDTASVTLTGPPCEADLSLLKSVDKNPAFIGDLVRYTFTAANAGPMPQTGVAVTDTLPAGLEFVDSNCGAYVSPGPSPALIWPVGNLGIGQSVSCQVGFRVVACDDSDLISNTATVIGGDPALTDPDDTNDSSTVDLVVECTGELSITKTLDNDPDPATFNHDDLALYTITVTNNGAQQQSGVLVSDDFPGKLTFVDATCDTWLSQGVRYWEVGTLAAGASVSCTLRYRVRGCAAITNTARVTGKAFLRDDPADNAVTVTTNGPLCEADLSVNKVELNGLASARIGDVVTYVLTAANTGPMPETGVTVAEDVPPGLLLVDNNCGIYTDTVTGNLVWNVGDLAIGGSAVCQLQFRVTACDQVDGVITNTAVITGGATNLTDPDPSNDADAWDLAVPCEADLGITKAVSQAAAKIGDVLTYELAVTNAGPMPQTGVTVTDPVPAELLLVDSNCGALVQGGALVWPIGNLAVGQTVTCQVRYRVVDCADDGTVDNTATVAGDIPEPATEVLPNAASVSVAVPCEADLGITKAASQAAAKIGDVLTYELAVTNAGPMPQTGVTVTDPVPAELLLVDSNCGALVQGGALVWPIGNLAVDQTVTCQVRYRVVDCADDGTVDNTATVAGDIPEPATEVLPNTASVSVAVPCEADLSILKVADRAAAEIGDIIAYTFTVTNNGPMPQTDVVVTDPMPPSVTLLDDNCGASYDAAANTLTWVAGDLAVGESKSCQMRFTVIWCEADGQIQNTATVTGNQRMTDPDLANNSSTESVRAPRCRADLAIVKTPDVAAAQVGDVIAYTFTVTNNGPMPQTGVTVTDPMPPSVVLEDDNCGASYDAAANTLTWVAGDLAVDETKSCQVRFRVVWCEADGSIDNTATVAGGDPRITDPVPANNSSTAHVAAPRCQADLSILKTADRTQVEIGDVIAYTFAVTNAGPMPQTGVTVTDPMPPSVTLLDQNCGGTYDAAANTLTWVAGDLAVGETKSCQVRFRVVWCEADGFIDNEASVAGGDTRLPDPNPSNNISFLRVAAPFCLADLAILKTADRTQVVLDDVIAYTFTVTNAGPMDQTGVTVTDPMPGSVALEDSNCGAFHDAASNVLTWVAGDLAAGQRKSCQVRFRVVWCEPDGSIDNTARVVGGDQSIFDPDFTNNESTVRIAAPFCRADLGIVKVADRTSAQVGDEIAYTFTVTNHGPMPQTGVTVTDPMPPSVAILDDNCGASHDVASNILSWPVGDLAVGESKSCQVRFRVVWCEPDGIIDNTATVVGGDTRLLEPSPDTLHPNQSSAQVSAPFCVADLGLTKTADRESAEYGDRVTYTLTAANYGPMPQTGVTVTDSIPAGVELVDNNCGAFIQNGQLIWRVGDLPPGSSVVCQVSFTALCHASGHALNQAVIAGSAYGIAEPDPDTLHPNAASWDLAIPTCEADISLDKTADTAEAEWMQTVAYTLSVTNHGPMPATAVTVVDTVPAGLTLLDNNCGASLAGGLLTWPVGDLAVDATRTCQLRFSATCAPNGHAVNVATVSGLPTDPVTANNSDTWDLLVPRCEADLVIQKGVDPLQAEYGERVTYTLTVSNLGPLPQSGVTVVDTIPKGIELLDNNCGAVADFGVLTWPVGNLPAGESRVCQVAFIARCNANGHVINTATVSGAIHDPVSSNNTDQADLTVPQCLTDLSIEKTADRNEAEYGERVTYTLTARNLGPMPETAVVVTDTVPEGLSLVDSNCGASLRHGLLTWPVGALPVNGAAVCQVAFAVTCAETGLATNTAEIQGILDDSNPANNTDTWNLSVPGCLADLSIDKTADRTTAVNGELVTYNLKASNLGPLPATGVVVTDTVPAGLTLVDNNCGAVLANNLLTWEVGDLDADATEVCQVTFAVSCAASGQVVNEAVIIGRRTDPVSGNNRDTWTLTVPRCLADLSLDKTADRTTADVGQTVRYTLTAANAGPMDQTGVMVTDSIPYGLSLTDANCGAWIEGSTLYWSVGSLPAGASRVCQLRFTVSNCVNDGVVTNTAAVTGGAPGVTDPVPANNSDSWTLTVDPCLADLSVDKTADRVAAEVGDLVTYTLTVANAGPMDQTGVTVLDSIPFGLELADYNCGARLESNSLVWSVGDLPAGKSRVCQVVFRVASCSGTGTLVNTATVVGAAIGVSDPDPADNADTWSLQVARCLADLAVEKAADRSSAAIGQTVTYTLTASNAGPSPQEGVRVTDVIPGNLLLVDDNCGARTESGNLVWPVGYLAAGESATCQVAFRVVACSANGTTTNTATIAGTAPGVGDPDLANNSDTVTIGVPLCQADLSVDVAADTGVAVLGDRVTYTYTVANAGPAPQEGVLVTSPLADALRLVDGNCGAHLADGVLVWPVGALAVGETRVCQMVFQVADCDPDGVVNDIVSVAGGAAGISDPVLSNNSDRWTLQVQRCLADLSIDKTADRNSAALGGLVTYTLTAANAGPMPQEGVLVIDQVPYGLELADANCGVTMEDDLLIWPVGSLPAGASTACRLVFRVASCVDAGSIVNTATISGGDISLSDPVPTNNSDRWTLAAPRCQADLELVKTGSATVAEYGQQVTYDLTVHNAGPMDATNVVVRDVVPAGLSVVGTTCGAAAVADGLSWPVGAIPVGQTVSCQVYAVVTGCGQLINTASVVGFPNDPDPTDNAGSWAVTGRNCTADLEVALSTPTPLVTDGQVVTLTLGVTNNGPMNQTGVTASASLPEGLTTLTTTCGTAAGGRVTWTIGSLEAGASVSCQISARVDDCGTLLAEAQVSGAATDPNPANNVVTTPLEAECAGDLSIVKTAGTAPAAYGSVVTFTLTATNHGPNAQENVYVVDTLPEGLEFTGSTCTTIASAGVVYWFIGPLADGATVSCQISARVAGCGELTNEALVVGGIMDPDASDNISRATVSVSGCAGDLSIRKTTPFTSVALGDTVAFTLTVANAGPVAQKGVVVTDTLPPGLAYAGSTCPVTQSGQVLTWNVGSLAAGGSADCLVYARVTACGELRNTARVAGDLYDPDPSDDTASVVLSAGGCWADLELIKIADQYSAAWGQTVAMTLTVINHGPMGQTGVTVTDTLPEGLELVEAGCPISQEGDELVWSVGDLPAGEPAECTLTVRVAACGAMVNGAVVKGDVADPKGYNNGDSVTVVGTGCLGDLDVDQTAAEGANYGDEVTFTVTVSNHGPVGQSGVYLIDSFTDGLSLRGNDCGALINDGQLFWVIGELPAGAAVTCQVQALATRCGGEGAAAMVYGTVADPMGNNTASANLAVSNCPVQIFKDNFRDGKPNGDADWAEVKGDWVVTRNRELESNPGLNNIALVKNAGFLNLDACRLVVDVNPTNTRTVNFSNGGLIFAYQGPNAYRYVRFWGGRLVIGQVGAVGSDPTPGLKTSVRLAGPDTWRNLTVDVDDDGTVRASVDGKLALTHAFPEAVNGRYGIWAFKARTLFDNFTAWDKPFLP